MSDDVKDAFEALLSCGGCDFTAHVDGCETEEEVQDVMLQISKLHARQRHGEVSSFQTDFRTYETSTDTAGRPKLN